MLRSIAPQSVVFNLSHSLVGGNSIEEELSGVVARGKHVDGSGKVVVSLTMQACSRGKCDGDDDREVGSGLVFRNHFAKPLCALSR